MTNLRWGQGNKKRHTASERIACQEAIISAATVCYARLGMNATSTDIANEAKVTRQTIYNYFENYDHLRIAVVTRIWSGIRPIEETGMQWINSVNNAIAFRLGKLSLWGELYEDLTAVVLSQAQTLEQEGCARLLLSYLKMDKLNGSPLPLFEALLSSRPVS